MNNFIWMLTLYLSHCVHASNYFDGRDNGPYLDWLNDKSFDRQMWLKSPKNASLGIAVHWSIEEPYIRFGFAAKASGWVGFGISEAGGMRGSDVVLYSVESNELVDSYILDELATPYPDDCQSWTLLNSSTENGFILVEARRLLDTGDSQDRPIIDDSNEFVLPSRVIAAWGDTPSPSYHGLENRAKGVIRFMGAISSDASMQERQQTTDDLNYFEVKAVDYVIPSLETTYAYFCFSAADLVEQGVPIEERLHITRINPVIDSNTSQYVHHFILTGMEDPWSSSANCSLYEGFEIVYGWAPGDLPVILPDEVGTPLGQKGFQSFKLEIHYDNPRLDRNKVDNSGVRLYYTNKIREFDMGVFQTGDPFLGLQDLPVSSNGTLAKYDFNCNDACSSLFLKTPVTVIAEHLHMHKSGLKMVNTQKRNNKVIRSGEVQFWDFDQQGSLGVVQQPFVIQPGDGFQTTCYYNGQEKQVFGLGSSQEMCIAYIYYYPRQTIAYSTPFTCAIGLEQFIPGCGIEWEASDMNDIKQIGRSFGLPPKTCLNKTVLELSPTAVPSDAPISLGYNVFLQSWISTFLNAFGVYILLSI